MEPAALPAARISRRPDEGGAGKCGCRQLAGCAAATAARNRSSRRAREDAVTVFGRKRCAACHGEAMFRLLRFASALPLLPSTIQPAKGINVPGMGTMARQAPCDGCSPPALESGRLHHYPIRGQVRKSSGPLLVSRFRRSYHFAAPAFTNVGNKGTLASHDPSVALHLTFL
jgi:hypothetical protein